MDKLKHMIKDFHLDWQIMYLLIMQYKGLYQFHYPYSQILKKVNRKYQKVSESFVLSSKAVKPKKMLSFIAS